MEREAQFIKTLETQQQEESNNANDLPQLNLANLEGNPRNTPNLYTVDPSLLSQIQSQWTTQLQSFLDHNKLLRDQGNNFFFHLLTFSGYTKRVEDLEEQLTKLRVSSEEKEHHLQEQITMWKEKTNIKQQSLSSVNLELEDLNSKLKLKNEEYTKLEQELSRKKEELEVVVDDSRRRMKEYSDKDEQIAELQEEVKKRDGRIAELGTEIENMKTEIKNREQQYSKMSEQSEV
jgi:chromosome segregation ATPase